MLGWIPLEALPAKSGQSLVRWFPALQVLFLIDDAM